MGSAAKQWTFCSKCAASPLPCIGSVESWLVAFLGAGRVGLTQQNPPIACSSTTRAGLIGAPAWVGTASPLSQLTKAWLAGWGPSRSLGRRSFRVGSMNNVWSCSDTRMRFERSGGQDGGQQRISGGFRTKPVPPFSSNSARWSWVGRSGVCKFNATSDIPDSQARRGSKLSESLICAMRCGRPHAQEQH